MQLAVSDLGFDGIENVANVLQQNGIEYIEVVPSKIKPYHALNVRDMLMYKDILADYNLKPYSFLSLFYGIEIKDLSEVDKILNHFQVLITYAQLTEVKKLVFGSPALRKKSPNWEQHLQYIFTRLDKMLDKTGISVIIEPVSSYYKAEFWYETGEIVNFIVNNKLKNIRTMVDTHNAMLEGEDPCLLYLRWKQYIGHIHIAEIGLGRLKSVEMHLKFSNTIRDYKDVITHEITDKLRFAESVKTFSEIYK